MKKSKNEKIEIPVISTTHWDREWRFSFQQTRTMLVYLMDNLISVLQSNPDFKSYHLDAQTAVLEDYLDIRPEKYKELKKLIKDGRILVGPWYTLPDFCVINGESIIRNLLMGHRVAREFGRTMKVGYTPTGFGSISQIPQIYAGFDIDTMLFYRGVDRDKLKKEFIWQAPDGSNVIAYTFTPEYGRMPLFHCVASKVFRGKDFYDRQHQWNSDEGAFRLNDDKSRKDIYYHTQPKQYLNLKSLKKNIEQLVKTELKHSQMKTFLLVDGVDSTEPQPMLSKLLKEMNRISDKFHFYHTDLYDFAEKLREISPKLNVYMGEMRSSAKYGVQVNLMGAAISSRIYLKQKNQKVENALINWAEPFSAFAFSLGSEYPGNYLDKAWKYLLWNQSHDSIAGCSQDIVHKDMMYYFRQSSEIADVATEQALRNIAANINTKKHDKKSIFLVVYNPLCFNRTDIVLATIDIPFDEKADSVKVIDEKGRPMPVQVNSVDLNKRILIHRPKDVPCFYKAKRFSVQFQAEDIPSLGYKVFHVLPENKNKPTHIIKTSQRGRMIQNEYLSLKANSDGTFDLKDLKTGRIFPGINQFEDSGEAGDPWTRKEPENNKIIYGPAAKPNIEVQNSGLCNRIKVRFAMKIPAESDILKRSRKKTLIDIETTATIKQGCPWLEFQTKVNNRAKDHRLRVIFPSGVKTNQSFAELPFDIIERPIKPIDTTGWFERGYTTYPQQSFCGLKDNKGGLAIFNKGLSEYEVVDNAQRTIALTLLRCYKMFIPKLKEPDLEQEGCQCLIQHEFDYAVYPFALEEPYDSILKKAKEYQIPLKVAQSARQKGNLPSSLSFLEISAPFMVSAVKKTDDHDTIIIRLYNPTKKSHKGWLKYYKPISKAWLVNMNEQRKRKMNLFDKNTISLLVKPQKIVNIEIEV